MVLTGGGFLTGDVFDTFRAPWMTADDGVPVPVLLRLPLSADFRAGATSDSADAASGFGAATLALTAGPVLLCAFFEGDSVTVLCRFPGDVRSSRCDDAAETGTSSVGVDSASSESVCTMAREAMRLRGGFTDAACERSV